MRLLVGLVLVLVVAAPAAAKVRAPACPDGQFVVEGAPLLDVPIDTDVVVLEGRLVSTVAGCAAKKAKVGQGGKRLGVRWRSCGTARKVRLKARFAADDCDRLDGTWRRKGEPVRRFVATRAVCGDGRTDGVVGEVCDDGNQRACDGCGSDCRVTLESCVAAYDCSEYTRPPLPAPGACPDPSAPDALTSCGVGSGNVGRWTVDADGLPAYDFAVDQRCDAAAAPFTPRATPLRDPIHAVGNGRGLMAMAHASGAVEVYTQDRGHKWLNRVDTWRDPENPSFPPQVGGGFSYWAVRQPPDAPIVGSTRFDDLPVESATTMQSRRFGVGYFETETRTPELVLRRRVLAPDAEARALVVEVTLENPTATLNEYLLTEVWDLNLHQAAVELLTSDLLQAGITDDIQRRRREQAAAYTQTARWDPTRGVAVVETTAKTLAPGITRESVASVDWFPEPVWLAVIDDGPAPDRVYLSDAELWERGPRTPSARLAASSDGAHARELGLDGSAQPALLGLRVPVVLEAGAKTTRRFAFGMVPGGGTPDAALAELRGRATTIAADTAASWRERLVWASFPGQDDAAAMQRELAWASYATLANVSYDEYRGLRVAGQGGAYRFIHGLDGAMGDLALFAESLLLVDPPVARETLAYALTSQHASTSATPWRYPYASTGVGNFSDVGIYYRRSDAYWFLPAIVGKYVGLTRDASFLSEPLPYWPRAAGESGTVLDHIGRGLDFALDESLLGIAARGLVAIGTNDYADGVNNLSTEPVSPTGASSTYNAGMIAYGFPLAADVIEPVRAPLATRMRDLVTSQSAAYEAEAWLGQYYARGFTDSGNAFAPQLFFLEPQVFPVLAGTASAERRDAALDAVVEALESPYGALSNVAVDDSGPIGGIDQPLVGGVWPVANAWLTAAFAQRDGAEAWSSFTRNTLWKHAEIFPELWYGIWTGPDSFNGPDSTRPGEADAHLATALTDYPALNAHVHTGPLRALTDVVGVAGTGAGLRIAPHVPGEAFHVRWPRLELEWAPNSARGAIVPVGSGDVTMEVVLPSALASAVEGGDMLVALVNDAEVPVTVTSGVASFVVPGVAEARATWSLAVE